MAPTRTKRVVGHIAHPVGCLACGFKPGGAVVFEPCRDQQKAQDYASKGYAAMPASEDEFERWKAASS